MGSSWGSSIPVSNQQRLLDALWKEGHQAYRRPSDARTPAHVKYRYKASQLLLTGVVKTIHHYYPRLSTAKKHQIQDCMVWYSSLTSHSTGHLGDGGP